MASLVYLVKWEKMDSQVQKAIMVLKDHLDYPELVYQARKANPDSPAYQAKKASLAYLEKKVIEVDQAILAAQELQDSMDHLASLALKATMAHAEATDSQALLVSQDRKAKMDSLANPDSLVKPDHQAYLASQVYLELLEVLFALVTSWYATVKALKCPSAHREPRRFGTAIRFYISKEMKNRTTKI